jgi:hypothetical protein
MKTTIALLLTLSAGTLALPTAASAQDETGCRNMCGIHLVRGVPEQGRQQVTRKQNSCYRTCMRRTPSAGAGGGTLGTAPRKDGR